MHIPFVHTVKFKFLAKFPVDLLAHPVTSNLIRSSVLIYCIRLLRDWSFCLYPKITYICCFVASYLFLLWYGWSLWRYFVLLLEEIQFPFLSQINVFSREMSLVSRLNVHRVVFLPIFVFWLFPFCWSSCRQYCFWWLLSVFLRTFLCSRQVVVSVRQHCKLASIFPPFSLDTLSVNVISGMQGLMY